MIVEFKSHIKRDGFEDEIIQFSAPVSLGQRDSFISWEFQEPSQNIMNLVEANDEYVNIFAGPQTIQLKLRDKITNSYQPEGVPMPIVFQSFLEELEIDNHDLLIKYTLWQGQQIIGSYTLTLKVK